MANRDSELSHPRIQCGPRLNSAWTDARSSPVWARISVSLGKEARSAPSLSSCSAAARASAVPVGDLRRSQRRGDIGVPARLLALVPRRRGTQVHGQGRQRGNDRVTDGRRLCLAPGRCSRNGSQLVPSTIVTLHRRVARAHDQMTFPMTGLNPSMGRWSIGVILTMAPSAGPGVSPRQLLMARPAQHSAGPLTRQAARVWTVDGLADRLGCRHRDGWPGKWWWRSSSAISSRLHRASSFAVTPSRNSSPWASRPRLRRRRSSKAL